MTTAKKLLSTQTGGGKLYVDDVFSTYLYTGNGTSQTINNGIDLAGEGGLVWTKCRSNSDDHMLADTIRGPLKILKTHTSDEAITVVNSVTAFAQNGFSIGNDSRVNRNLNTYVAWAFRNSPKYFKCATVVKYAGSNATVDLSSLGTVGMVRVKRTDLLDSWYVWHRSVPTGKLLIGESTSAAVARGHITVSGTTLTLVNGVIADGAYVVYAWAHDTSSNGLIQCGSFTTTSSSQEINLGWEPQYILWKHSSSASDWYVVDNMRGWDVDRTGTTVKISPNTSDVEQAWGQVGITSTGFTHTDGTAGNSIIYLAIRRGPMRVPTDGTKVFKPIARMGTGAAATVSGVGFAPDCAWVTRQAGTNGTVAFDRLRGACKYILPTSTTAEESNTSILSAFGMDGVSLDANSYTNSAATNYINHFFKRAPGFFDIVCYTGTSAMRNVPHGLGVAPELMIVKRRNAADNWYVYSNSIAITEYLKLNLTDVTATSTALWNSTTPTETTFSLGATGQNGNGVPFVAYLFASLPGISKVGSYTGNGTTQTIPCGFSTGARFILVKSIDAAGDWYVWDSARGIVSANDPHLSLNTTVVEVTTDDSVDPYAGGFIVNQNTATNININGKRYIFLAIA